MDSSNIYTNAAVVNIVGNVSSLLKAINQGKTALSRFSYALAEIGKRCQAIGTIITEPFANAAMTFAEFDKQMRTVRAVTNSTGADFTKLTEKAKELGATTSFTASQVAEGMTALGRMGFNSNEIDGNIQVYARNFSTHPRAQTLIGCVRLAPQGICNFSTYPRTQTLSGARNARIWQLELPVVKRQPLAPFQVRATRALDPPRHMHATPAPPPSRNPNRVREDAIGCTHTRALGPLEYLHATPATPPACNPNRVREDAIGCAQRAHLSPQGLCRAASAPPPACPPLGCVPNACPQNINFFMLLSSNAYNKIK